MPEPLRRDQTEGRRSLDLLDDDAPPVADTPVEEASDSGRFSGTYARAISAGLVLVAGIVATGLVGSMVSMNLSPVENVPVFIQGFLLAGGLFTGMAVAGTYARRVWAWVALMGLATMIATAYALSVSVHEASLLDTKQGAQQGQTSKAGAARKSGSVKSGARGQGSKAAQH